MSEPVDAVITWVDGNDKVHANKLADYLAKAGVSRPEAAAPTRFNECGELDYCVNSLLQFAPWLRTIFIVTDAQTPPILQKLQGTPYAKKVKLIDHRDIFAGFEHCLPTFNSLTLESLLWRIPGLAEHFIYVNDDCMIIRPVTRKDFFHDNKLVIRGSWKRRAQQKAGHILKQLARRLLKKAVLAPARPFHRLIQENTALLAGFSTHFYALPHAPLGMHKNTLATYFLEHQDLLVQNIGYALRDERQFWTISLAQHLEIKANNVVFDNHLKAVMVNGEVHSADKIRSRLARADNDPAVTFICIQSLDAASEENQQLLFAWLAKYINIPIH